MLQNFQGVKITENKIVSQKPAEIKSADVTAKVDLKKSNPKEYYASSSISFKELRRSS